MTFRTLNTQCVISATGGSLISTMTKKTFDDTVNCKLDHGSFLSLSDMSRKELLTEEVTFADFLPSFLPRSLTSSSSDVSETIPREV